jgi:hypothetical protein
MRIFKHRSFNQWTKSESLPDETLRKAVQEQEMEKGLYEASLGSGLYKKRVAIHGKGKSGGYRTLVAFKGDQKAFFVYGFAKNVRADISESEKKIYRKIAKDLLRMDENTMQKMMDNGKLFEVK